VLKSRREEHGAGSREQGAGSKGQGAWGRVKGAGSQARAGNKKNEKIKECKKG